jgi:hypothetical protein
MRTTDKIDVAAATALVAAAVVACCFWMDSYRPRGRGATMFGSRHWLMTVVG